MRSARATKGSVFSLLLLILDLLVPLVSLVKAADGAPLLVIIPRPSRLQDQGQGSVTAGRRKSSPSAVRCVQKFWRYGYQNVRERFERHAEDGRSLDAFQKQPECLEDVVIAWVTARGIEGPCEGRHVRGAVGPIMTG